ILQTLVETIRTVTDRGTLAMHLEREIHNALHPLKMAVYLEQADGPLKALAARADGPLDSISRDEFWLDGLAERVRPWEVPPGVASEVPVLRGLKAELLVPIVSR